jgi:hypothetical protein
MPMKTSNSWATAITKERRLGVTSEEEVSTGNLWLIRRKSRISAPRASTPSVITDRVDDYYPRHVLEPSALVHFDRVTKERIRAQLMPCPCSCLTIES